jgi:hypothetical protein
VNAVAHRARLCLAIALGVLFLTTASALAVLGNVGQYTGTTSQSRAITFEVVRTDTGKRVRNGQIHYRAQCMYGAVKGYVNFAATIQTDGSFSKTFTFRNDAGGGYVAHNTVTIGGKFTSKTAANGTFTNHIRITYNGQLADKCNTPTVTWNAHHV